MDRKEITGFVYAFTMGDGGLYYSNKTARNPVFIANCIVDNRDYVEWRANILEALTKVRIYEIDQSHRAGHKNLLRTVTNTHPLYTKVYNRLYIERKKVIDPHQLTFMSWQFLAILYQEDGNVNVDKRCNATPIVSIATKSFSYGDNVLLKRAIAEKLGIHFKVTPHNYKDKRYWYLRLNAKQYDTFREGIEPYILPSFHYKIPVNTNRTISP